MKDLKDAQTNDWIGGTPAPKPFRDIRSRPSTAEREAELSLELRDLLIKIPLEVKEGGSIELVRKWKYKREAALKIAAAKRSSTVELQYAIRCMRDWNK